MTAIVAARISGGVLVGSDRCWSDGVSTSICGPKTIRVGSWLLALAGAAQTDWDDLHDRDPRTPKQVGQMLGPCEASAILVRGTQVRYGECDGGTWSWGRVYCDVAAGSGGPAALAAWQALQTYEADPVTRMRVALKACAKRDPTVCGPFDVMWA